MKEISKKIIAIIVVMLMIVNSSMLTLISVAAENINKSNVSLTAYFIGEDGNKTDKLETSMATENLKLVLEIGVNQQGYFNGEVTFNNSNFKIKSCENNTYISELNENSIKLNQINAGESANIVLDIIPIKEDTYEIDMLNRSTDIQILGTYVAGENENIEIQNSKSVTLVLKNPYLGNEENAFNFDANIVTNKVYSIDGENKRLIQLEIESGLQNNLYPIKSTKITLDVLDEVENVKVSKRGTYATNNDKDEVQYNWDKKENKLEINIVNENKNGKVEWNKTKKDTVLVTYILSEDVSLENKKINITDEVGLYGEMSTTFKKDINLNDMSEKDGVINYSISATSDIYKGNLYYGEDTNILEISTVDIRYQKISNKIIIDEGKSVYPVDNTENDANLLYNSTTVNKDELISILGENGKLTIKDINGNTLLTITKSILDSFEDENVLLTYSEQNNIIIEIENAENEGVLNLTHKKVLRENKYDRNQMKEFSKLRIDGILKTEENFEEKRGETVINLLEPISYAKITSNVDTLSTLQKNENVEFNVILKTDDIKYDLYKNPCVEIVLPKEISIVEAQINPVFIDGFTIGENTIYKNENGNNVLKILLSGEQRLHSNNVSEGIIINVNASLEIDKSVSTRDVEVVLNYTNENSEIEKFEEKLSMKIQSKDGLLFYDKVENFNSNGDVLETIANEKVEGKLDVNTDARMLSDKILLVNNYGTDISNITLIEKNNDGIDIELLIKAPITVSIAGARVYYSEDSINWVEDITQLNKVTAYKVVIEKINANDFIEITSAFNIPEKLEYNKVADIVKNVSYSIGEQEINQTKEIKLSTEREGILQLMQKAQTLLSISPVNVEQTEKEEVNASVETTLGTKKLIDSDSVHEGEIIKNTITIKNNTKSDITNVKVIANQQNAVIYDLVEVEVTNPSITGSDDEKIIEHTYGDWTTGEKKFDVIDKIAAGETKVLTYQARVKQVTEENQQTFGNIKVSADGIDDLEIATVKNSIISGKVELTVKDALNAELETYDGEVLKTDLLIKNTSGSEIKNMNVEIQLSKNLYLDNKDTDIKFYYNDGEWEELGTDKITNVLYDSDTNIIRFNITTLESNDDLIIIFDPLTRNTDTSTDKEMSEVFAKISFDNEEYYSNIKQKEVINISKDISLDYYIAEETKKEKYSNNDQVVFMISVKNNSKKDAKISIANEMSGEFKVEKANMFVGEESNDIISKIQNNYLFIFDEDIKAGQTINIIIITRVNYSEEKDVIVKNDVKLTGNDNVVLKDIEINLQGENLMANSKPAPDNTIDPDENNGEQEDPEQEENNGNNEKPEASNNKYKISGIVWNDKDKNGKKDISEKGIEDIEVRLITEDGEFVKDSKGNVISCKTNGLGEYYFDVENGRYIVTVIYDNQNYAVTEYKKAGVDEIENSNVISKEITINNENKVVAITDVININNQSVENINAGLYEREKFDLKIDKYITKVSVNNSQGINQYDLNKEKLAKIEIKAKNMKGSTIVAEYEITITNEGDIDGFVNDIVDYIPEGFEFNSELNKDWYVDKDKNLHNASLENVKIEPGKTKTVKLILTKTLKTDSGETAINNAEIYKASNTQNIMDKDSTPGNRANGEDDISSATLIISISTGAVKVFWGVITLLLILVGIIIFIIKRRGGLSWKK